MAEEVHICKRCGRSDMDAELKVEESTIQEYFRCSLGGRPFSKTFNIGDGTLSVTFEAPSADFMVEFERIAAKATNEDDLLDLRMLISLAEIKTYDEQSSGLNTVYKKSADERRKLFEDPKQALLDFSRDFDAVMLMLLRRVNLTFVLLLNEIVNSLVNKDFYKGVGLL